MDYQQYERECERIKEDNEELLSEFETWLQQKNLTRKTINKHLQNVEFYINHYLLYEEPREASEGVVAIRMFLGYWFIKKTMWASKAQIKENAASLKKFYKFMHEKGLVSKELYDEMLAEIKENMPEWLATMERFDDPTIDDPMEIWFGGEQDALSALHDQLSEAEDDAEFLPDNDSSTARQGSLFDILTEDAGPENSNGAPEVSSSKPSSNLSAKSSKVGRNEPCPCGSGKKYKKCCGSPVAEEDQWKGASEASSRRSEESGFLTAYHREPTLEEWRALYQAIEDFRETRCWEWMYNDDIFGVVDPETGETAYCCIMGALGEIIGVAAYLGAEGLDTLLDILSEQWEESSDWLFRLRCIMASLENRNELSDRDLAVIKQLGLKYRGKKQWPMFRSYEPGLYPWFINAWQCRFMTEILHQAREVALRCRQDKSVLEHEETENFLVRVPFEQEGSIYWEDHYPEIPEFDKTYVSLKITDELKLKKLQASLKNSKKEGTWEADVFWLDSAVRENKNERPYFPLTFLLADASSGFLIGNEIIKNLEEEGDRCIDALLKVLMEGKAPTKIVVENMETYYLLGDVCQQLDIPLRLVEQLKIIPDAREELSKLSRR